MVDLAKLDERACQSYRKGRDVCSDGFIQTRFCRVGLDRCHVCGSDHGRLPHCLSEDIPERFLTGSGLPLFYAPAASERGR